VAPADEDRTAAYAGTAAQRRLESGLEDTTRLFDGRDPADPQIWEIWEIQGGAPLTILTVIDKLDLPVTSEGFYYSPAPA
jgi:hypothetical protein